MSTCDRKRHEKKPKQLLGGRQPWILRDRDILTPERYERAERILNELMKNRKSNLA